MLSDPAGVAGFSFEMIFITVDSSVRGKNPADFQNPAGSNKRKSPTGFFIKQIC
jgi:hypothetical protein